MARASHACRICKARKKGCDKALPRCGPCVRRGLPCSYREPGCSHENKHPPIKPSLPSGHLDSFLDVSDINLDTTLHFHLGKLLRLTNLSVGRIGEQYFRDLHRGLPILCPTLFRENVANYKGRVPPADFSILLLALCLLAWNPSSSPHLRRQSIRREAVHATVRMLFARIQAIICASKALAQASLLIAAYEYAAGQPRVANISLGTCARIISAIGLSLQNAKDLKDIPEDRHLRLKAREELNLWWAVATFERIVLCDIPSYAQLPILQYPCQKTPLPPDLPPAQDHSERPSLSAGPILAAIHENSISGFGRQIQATYLLNSVLQVIGNPINDEPDHIAHLKRLDQELQGLMAILIRDCHHEWRYYCGAIGTAVRSLFLLHNHVQTLPVTNTKIFWRRKSSQAALDFVTNIMVDVAHDHIQRVTSVNAGALPLSCAYNLRASIDHIEHRQRLGRGVPRAALDSLVALEGICFQRWRDNSGDAENGSLPKEAQLGVVE